MAPPTIRGVSLFLSDVRGCATADQEHGRVLEELGKIRQRFTSPRKSLSGYEKKKCLVKLIYIHLLGYPVDIGHAEAVSLLSSPLYSERAAAYLFCSMLLMNGPPGMYVELRSLCVGSIKKDLSALNREDYASLALDCASHISDEAGASDLFPFVQAIANPAANATMYIRQKAYSTMLHLFRVLPTLLRSDIWASRLGQALLFEQDLSCLLALTNLVLAAVLRSQQDPQEHSRWLQVQLSVVNTLARIISGDVPVDAFYHEVPAPWLAIRLLQLLQLFNFSQFVTAPSSPSSSSSSSSAGGNTTTTATDDQGGALFRQQQQAVVLSLNEIIRKIFAQALASDADVDLGSSGGGFRSRVSQSLSALRSAASLSSRFGSLRHLRHSGSTQAPAATARHSHMTGKNVTENNHTTSPTQQQQQYAGRSNSSGGGAAAGTTVATASGRGGALATTTTTATSSTTTTYSSSGVLGGKEGGGGPTPTTSTLLPSLSPMNTATTATTSTTMTTTNTSPPPLPPGSSGSGSGAGGGMTMTTSKKKGSKLSWRQSASTMRHALLFEAINLVSTMQSAADTGIKRSAAAVLMNFVNEGKSNIRYKGLSHMASLAADHTIQCELRKSLPPILQILKEEEDSSIRKQATEVAAALGDPISWSVVVYALLTCLREEEEDISQEDVANKIALLVRAYAPDSTWLVDVVFKMMEYAPQCIRDETWMLVVHALAGTDTNQSTNKKSASATNMKPGDVDLQLLMCMLRLLDSLTLQRYAVRRALIYLKHRELHDTFLRVCGYLIGEYGHLIKEEVPGHIQVEILLMHIQRLSCAKNQFSRHSFIPVSEAPAAVSSVSLLPLLLLALVKIAHTHATDTQRVLRLLHQQQDSEDLEVQTRAVELATLLANRQLTGQTLMMMPPFNLKACMNAHAAAAAAGSVNIGAPSTSSFRGEATYSSSNSSSSNTTTTSQFVLQRRLLSLSFPCSQGNDPDFQKRLEAAIDTCTQDEVCAATLAQQQLEQEIRCVGINSSNSRFGGEEEDYFQRKQNKKALRRKKRRSDGSSTTTTSSSSDGRSRRRSSGSGSSSRSDMLLAEELGALALQPSSSKSRLLGQRKKESHLDHRNNSTTTSSKNSSSSRDSSSSSRRSGSDEKSSKKEEKRDTKKKKKEKGEPSSSASSSFTSPLPHHHRRGEDDSIFDGGGGGGFTPVPAFPGSSGSSSNASTSSSNRRRSTSSSSSKTGGIERTQRSGNNEKERYINQQEKKKGGPVFSSDDDNSSNNSHSNESEVMEEEDGDGGSSSRRTRIRRRRGSGRSERRRRRRSSSSSTGRRSRGSGSSRSRTSRSRSISTSSNETKNSDDDNDDDDDNAREEKKGRERRNRMIPRATTTTPTNNSSSFSSSAEEDRRRMNNTNDSSSYQKNLSKEEEKKMKMKKMMKKKNRRLSADGTSISSSSRRSRSRSFDQDEEDDDDLEHTKKMKKKLTTTATGRRHKDEEESEGGRQKQQQRQQQQQQQQQRLLGLVSRLRLEAEQQQQQRLIIAGGGGKNTNTIAMTAADTMPSYFLWKYLCLTAEGSLFLHRGLLEIYVHRRFLKRDGQCRFTLRNLSDTHTLHIQLQPTAAATAQRDILVKVEDPVDNNNNVIVRGDAVYLLIPNQTAAAIFIRLRCMRPFINPPQWTCIIKANPTTTTGVIPPSQQTVQIALPLPVMVLNFAEPLFKEREKQQTSSERFLLQWEQLSPPTGRSDGASAAGAVVIVGVLALPPQQLPLLLEAAFNFSTVKVGRALGGCGIFYTATRAAAAGGGGGGGGGKTMSKSARDDGESFVKSLCMCTIELKPDSTRRFPEARLTVRAAYAKVAACAAAVLQSYLFTGEGVPSSSIDPSNLFNAALVPTSSTPATSAAAALGAAVYPVGGGGQSAGEGARLLLPPGGRPHTSYGHPLTTNTASPSLPAGGGASAASSADMNAAPTLTTGISMGRPTSSSSAAAAAPSPLLLQQQQQLQHQRQQYMLSAQQQQQHQQQGRSLQPSSLLQQPHHHQQQQQLLLPHFGAVKSAAIDNQQRMLPHHHHTTGTAAATGGAGGGGIRPSPPLPYVTNTTATAPPLTIPPQGTGAVFPANSLF